MLNNLISNAIKFTQAGSVVIEVAPAAGKPGYLRFAVQDIGMGIPAEAAGLVFEKFRQVDQSITRAHQGTGLGLSLAKQLVELMGGEIGLHSVVDEGTLIHFTLPIGETEAAGPAQPDEARSTVPAVAQSQ